MIYPKIKEILDKEINRQNDTIELIASENFASQACLLYTSDAADDC